MSTVLEDLISVLIAKGAKISVAESVTGGLIASKIVSVAGASKIFYEGIIAYSENAKIKRLNVPKKLMREKTAVSPEVCSAMLDGLFLSGEIDYAIATTGYAETGKSVYVGVGARSGFKKVELVSFSGDRNQIRENVADYAINLLKSLA